MRSKHFLAVRVLLSALIFTLFFALIGGISAFTATADAQQSTLDGEPTVIEVPVPEQLTYTGSAQYAFDKSSSAHFTVEGDGREYALMRDGELVTDWKTAEDGKVTFDGLEAGTSYDVIERCAAADGGLVGVYSVVNTSSTSSANNQLWLPILLMIIIIIEIIVLCLLVNKLHNRKQTPAA